MNTKKRKNKTVRMIAIVLAFLLASAAFSFLTTPYSKDYYVEPTTSGKKQIALTFDDGPGKYTEQLLDGLRERNIKASFFLMGRKVEKRQETVKTMYDDGHLVGVHTWSHIDFFKSSREQIHGELERTNDLIESITGERPKFFRPPYGHYLGSQLNRIDQIAVLWSDSPRDWVHIDEDYICNYLVKHAKDGDIILLHDTKDATVPAVLRAIDILTEQGFEFVRVDELLCRNGDKLAPGLAYRFCPYDSRAWYI